MSQNSFFVFPEYKNQIPIRALQKSLDLVESIVDFSNGNSLDYEAINRINEKLGPRMKGTKLYPGGSSVLFGWSFSYDKIGSIIIKPYYSRELAALIIHYFTWQDFIHEFQKIQFEINDKKYRVNVPDTIGLAKIEALSRFYPVLITMEAPGETIQAYTPLIKNISNIVRDLAQKGIISDPYPSNWKVTFVGGQGVVQYIDLLSSNRLVNVHGRIADLIRQLD